MFLPYQRRWHKDQSVIKLMRGSRRIGKDYGDAWLTVTERLRGERLVDFNYSSRDELVAREYLEYVKHLCKLLSFVAEAVWGVEVFDGKAIYTGRIEFPEIDGRRPIVRVLSSAPGSFRGMDGDIGLSELAFHEDPRGLWSAASPVTTLGGRIRVVTTVNNEGDFVENLAAMGQRKEAGTPKPGDMPVSLHTVTIHDAVNEGLVEMVNRTRKTTYTRESFIEECRSKCVDAEQWEREYECKPSAQAGSYFPRSLSQPCVDEKASRPTQDVSQFIADVTGRMNVLGCKGSVYAGMDVGRKRDLTVVWAVGRVGIALHTLGVLVLDRRAFGEQREAVKRFMETCEVRRLCGDATGIGAQIMEELSGRYRSRVEAINITANVKADIFPGVRARLEERTVTLPECDATLADLASVRKEVTSSGNVRYAGERTEHGHADRACALALAVHAADSKRDTSRVAYSIGGASV